MRRVMGWSAAVYKQLNPSEISKSTYNPHAPTLYLPYIKKVGQIYTLHYKYTLQHYNFTTL